MTINYLTSTTDARVQEIENNSIILEPGSDGRLYQYPLYTVSIGQTFGAEMLVTTGSVNLVEDSFVIEKNIHKFEDEADAEDFLTQVGIENVASISESYGIRDDLTSYRTVEVQLIDFPKLKFDFDLINTSVEKGFKLEIFTSGSNGFAEVEKDVIFNAKGDLISETYLKYFEVEEDSQ